MEILELVISHKKIIRNSNDWCSWRDFEYGSEDKKVYLIIQVILKDTLFYHNRKLKMWFSRILKFLEIFLNL